MILLRLSFPGAVMQDDISLAAPIDFFTLVLIIAAEFELGLQGVFGIHSIKWIFGSWQTGVYDLIGFAAVWQLWRQRIFH